VAAADLNADGRFEVIAATGPGVEARVRAFDLTDLRSPNRIAQFSPFGSNYKGGVFVAAGDVNSDGFVDFIAGQGQGGSLVEVYNGATFTPLASFDAFSDFVNGARVALTDFDNTRGLELVVGSGAGKSSVIGKDLKAPPIKIAPAVYPGFSGVFVAGSPASGIQPRPPGPLAELKVADEQVIRRGDARQDGRPSA
jgi:hypothetical protein